MERNIKPNLYEPVVISLKMHGISYTVDGLSWDCTGQELKAEFSKLLVSAGFSPSVIEVSGGHYEWVDN